MGQMTASWSGDDWQDYSRELIAARHGAGYQPVPDTVGGDWGVEGFTSDGVLYQCYAAEEPLTTDQLYEKQRDKMTADLGKLRRNIIELAALLKPRDIRCWVLLVPRVEDKAILQHAAKKASEIRALQLDGVAGDFVVRVHTADDFPTECRQLDRALAIQVPEFTVDDNDVDLLSGDAQLDVATLDRKLAKLVQNDDDVVALRRQCLELYVRGRQMEDWVRRHHPALWERWQHSREGTKRTLKVAELTTDEAPDKRVSGLRATLESAAASAVPTMMATDNSLLAWGTIVDWLIECPLDFREGQ